MSMDLVAAGIDHSLRQLVATSDDTFGTRRALRVNLRTLRKLQNIADQDGDQSSYWFAAPQVSSMLSTYSYSSNDQADIRRQLEFAYLLRRLRRPQVAQIVSFSTVSVARPLAQIADKYTDQLEWSDFVESLFNQLSSYEVQSNRYKYNVADLDNFGRGEENGAQGITVQRNQLDVFFNQLSSAGLIQNGENPIDPQAVSDDWLRELNQLLEVTLKEELEFKEDGGVLTFKRSFVCLKDVVAKIAGRTDLKTLRVFAAHTIYVDANLELPEKNVTLLAPNLQPTGDGKWTVNLSGLDAPDETGSAEDGRLQDGKAVEPAQATSAKDGTSAGNFFSLFQNNSSLKMRVLANGGKGGRGQAGGKGAPGIDGQDAKLPDNYKGDRPDRRYKLLNENHDGPWTSWYRYLVYADSPGETGHKGGSGGSGGNGGNSGMIASHYRQFEYSADPGRAGLGGAGGAGGVSGRDGADSVYRIYYDYAFFFQRWRSLKEKSNSVDGYNQPGPVGDDGSTGAMGQTRTSQEFAYDLNAFQAYMLSRSDDRLLSSTLYAFLLFINQLDNLDAYYDARSLVDEFVQLIKPKRGATRKFELALYEELLERIEKFATSKVNESTPKDELTALQYLYASTLSKVCRLRRAAEGFLTINMAVALDNALDNIQKVKSAQAALVVRNTKSRFRADIMAMISDGHRLLDSQVFPVIEEIMKSTKDRMQDLFKEITDTKEHLEKDQKALEELKSTVIGTTILQSLVIVGKTVATLFGFGEIAEAVGEGASMGIKALGEQLADQDRPDNITKLPDGVTKSLAKSRLEAKLSLDSKADALKDRIDGIVKILSDRLSTSATYVVPMSADGAEDRLDLNALKESMLAMGEELSTAQKNLGDSLVDLNRKIDEIGVKVNVAVNKQSDLASKAVKGAKSAGEKESAEKDSEALDKTKVLKILGAGGKEAFGLATDTWGKMGKINKAFAQVQERLESLEAFKISITSTTIPIIEKAFNNMRNLETGLANKNQISLEFNKWQVKDKLSDLKELLKQTTKGFEVQDELARTIVKLDEAMTSVIGIYDRMQTYYSQAKLGDHIATIGGASLGDVGISDSKLKDSVLQMEYSARRDLMLEQYETSLAAMKQWVFPFAERYLREFELPSAFKPDVELDSIVGVISKAIEDMKSRIKDYISRIEVTDQIVRSEEFGDLTARSAPFYTWTGARYGAEIAALLSGKPVSILANIVRSPTYKSAIKFNRIGLEFVSKTSDQQTLNRTLEDFEVDLTHSGTSYYRVQNSYYQIVSTNLLISYSIRRRSDGTPNSRNDVYDKLRNGDLMLSPYALWTVQLRKTSPNVSFDTLKPYATNLDLLLVGEAKYVDETPGRPGKKLNLDKFDYERASVTELE